MHQAITVTFGDRAENHAGMEIIGGADTPGLDQDDMKRLYETLTGIGMSVEKVSLDIGLPNLPYAELIIVRGGVDSILGSFGMSSGDMLTEQKRLKWDKKILVDGRVVGKRARYNLCFGPKAQDPCYEEGRGRVVAWADVPATDLIRRFLAGICPKFRNLVAEGNNYYDARKCGIGFHGDTERHIVVAARLGVPIPLHYQWYIKHKPIGPRIKINLNHGDMYIMSDAAVGHTWKTSKDPVILHAAGASPFIS